jgi:hypothetical protein
MHLGSFSERTFAVVQFDIGPRSHVRCAGSEPVASGSYREK